eukprot:CAMPEP_0116871346 /NCGR_PEP_ID=MMETSP0463-20121206/1632_1 /TAXON_ID=181622 /ORGANISM="Strombidinopsis sp, Strain SopsisLIS2011" /LENGTH=66 /DNA_ID=CAMNT_0004509547 /DNA_START=339 /DNA_END=539 /DNA_ORIENTATION=+
MKIATESWEVLAVVETTTTSLLEETITTSIISQNTKMTDPEKLSITGTSADRRADPGHTTTRTGLT